METNNPYTMIYFTPIFYIRELIKNYKRKNDNPIIEGYNLVNNDINDNKL